jgi:hypothetical protein
VQKSKNDNGIALELLWLFLLDAEVPEFSGTALHEEASDDAAEVSSLEELIQAVLTSHAGR